MYIHVSLVSACECIVVFVHVFAAVVAAATALCCAAPHMAALGTHACSEVPFAVEYELILVET